MKKIIIFFFLIAICNKLSAQPSFTTRVNNNVILNDDSVTNKTIPGSLHPWNIGISIDSTWSLMQVLFNMVSASGSLQSVTSIGATTTNPMTVTDGATFATKVGISSINTTNVSGTLTLTASGIVSGKPGYAMKDNYSSNYSTIYSGHLSSSRNVLTPDEGNGSGLQSTLVLHKTKDMITVYNSGTDSTHIKTTELSVTGDAGLGLRNSISINQTGISFLQGSGSSFSGNILNQNPDGTNIFTNQMPMRDGVLATLGDISGSASQPVNQIVYGNGSGVPVTSSNNFQFNPFSNTETIYNGSGDAIVSLSGSGDAAIGSQDVGHVSINVLESSHKIDIGDNGVLINGIVEEINPGNGKISQGDINDWTTGIKSIIDIINGTVEYGDLDNRSTGMKSILDANNNNYLVGDISNLNNGLHMSVDVGNGVLVLGDNSAISTDVYESIDVLHGTIQIGDIDNFTNGVKILLDEVGNGISIGDVSGLNLGAGLSIDNANSVLYLGDMENTSTGTKVKVDVRNDVIDIGDPDAISNGTDLQVQDFAKFIKMGDVNAIDGKMGIQIANESSSYSGVRIGNVFSSWPEISTVTEYSGGKISSGDQNTKLMIDIIDGYVDLGDISLSGNKTYFLSSDPSSSIIANAKNVVLGDFELTNSKSQIKIDNAIGTISLGDLSNATTSTKLKVDHPNAKITIGDADNLFNRTKIIIDDQTGTSHQIITMTNALATPGFQGVTATSGTVTCLSTTRGAIVDPPSLATSLTIKLPASPADGQDYTLFFGGTISSGSVIASLTMSTPGASPIGTTTYSNVQAGSIILAHYISSTNKWFINLR